MLYLSIPISDCLFNFISNDLGIKFTLALSNNFIKAISLILLFEKAISASAISKAVVSCSNISLPIGVSIMYIPALLSFLTKPL